MGLIFRWGLGAGAAIAVVDILAGEVMRGLTDTDLAAAIELVDLLVNLALFGLAAHRVAAALGELRAGLEAAVLAGLVAGLASVAYQLARVAGPSSVESVSLLALNVVLAAAAGALGAWTGSSARREPPPGARQNPGR